MRTIAYKRSKLAVHFHHPDAAILGLSQSIMSDYRASLQTSGVSGRGLGIWLRAQTLHSVGNYGFAQKVVASCSHLDVPEFDFPAGRSAPRISEVDQRLASARENLLSRVIWKPYSRSWCN